MGSGKLSSKIIACPEPNLRGQAGTHAETREKGLTDRRGPAAPFLCAGHSRFSVPPQSQRAVLREPDIPERDLVMKGPFRYNEARVRSGPMEQRARTTSIAVNRSIILIVIAGVFALGIFIGRGTWLFSTGHDEREEMRSRMASEEFQFIRPSILQDASPETRKMRELQPFRYKVTALIDEQLEEGQATSVSVYFRDLDNGNWFGIHENEPFSPESQLKLPLMIAYFKWAETNPLVLRKKLVFSGRQAGAEPLVLKPPTPLVPGRSYTVNDLIFRMVAYSDNDAYALLAANMPPEHLRRIYQDLYMNYDPSKGEDVLSLSAYASFFRVLFNTSYLSEEMSEKALRYLSRASFRGGMAAGVPADVDIASKAGERMLQPVGPDQEGTVFQLHEFGIIYHSERPFLLGITVRGDDPEALADVIRDITRRIYTEVERQSN